MKLKPKLVLAFLLTPLIVVVAGIWFSQKQVPLEKITYAVGSGLHRGPVYIAIAKGYFKKEGLDVSLQEYDTGKEALNAVIMGKADLSTSAETPVMLAAMRREKIYVIATLVDTDKDVVIVARKDGGVSRPSDLKGKKIGVSIGTNGEFFMDAFLISHGILRNEVEVVNLSPKEMINALTKGQVDAVSTWNPHVIKLQRELGVKGITFYGEGIYTETFNISAAQDFAHKNPETIKKVLRSLIGAVEFIMENPDKSRRIISNHIKMDETLLGELWDIYHFKVTLDQSLLITLEDQARWAIKSGLTDKTASRII